MADIWDMLGAGLNIAGGIYGATQAKKASKAQVKAQEAAQTTMRPYAAVGDQAAGQLQNYLAGPAMQPFDFQDEPGYQFRLAEGEKAIDRSAGARGSRYSGATLKGLQRFAQDYAGNEYQNAFSRDNATRTRNYNMLAGGTQLGMNAQGTIGNYMSNVGDARAAGSVGAANALSGGFSDAYSGYNMSRYLNKPIQYLYGAG